MDLIRAVCELKKNSQNAQNYFEGMCVKQDLQNNIPKNVPKKNILTYSQYIPQNKFVVLTT